MTIMQAVVLAIIEGVTEYLPISSTGHLILASAFMGFNEDAFVKSFNVIVQFGAILSVLVLYWRRFKAPLSFYIKIAIAFLPAAVIGLLVKNKIDAVLGSVEIVATSMLLGGVILIWVDKRPMKSLKTVESMGYRDALIIGFCQCFAFIPGVSRAAASIVTGLFLGLSKKEAAEFSFFLAVPTLTGATLIKCLKIIPTIQADQIQVLLLGNFIAFVVGCLAIKSFIGFLTRQGFFAFGVYRIILGSLIFALLLSGWQLG